MKAIRFTSVLFFLSFYSIIAQVNFSGIVIDEQTGQPVEGVSILLPAFQKSTNTNDNGYFSIYIAEGKHQVIFSRIGYKSLNYLINTNEINFPLEVKMHQGTITLGEITVTSTRYQKLEKEVAIPLEVISKEKFDKNLTLSVPDAINTEPGITLVRDGIWGTDVNIRGLSRQNVVTLVDGNRIETATNHAAGLSLVDVFDIERVEVIKGGVSSLYGTGATGGAINILTKSIYYSDKTKFSGSVSSGYNSVNKGAIENLILSAASSNWLIKISSTLRTAVDTKTPNGTLPNSHFKDNYLSGLIGFKPTEKQELKITYQNFSGKDIGIPGGKSFPTTAIAKYSLAKRELISIEYSFKNLFPSAINTSLKYFYQEIERNVELRPNATTTTLPGAKHKTNGFQLNSNWLLNNFNQLVAGLDIWQRNYRGFRESIVKTSTTTRITGDYPVPNSEYRSIGIFAQNESKLFDNKLSLTIGGRYDLIKVTNDETRNPVYITTNGVINNNPPKNVLGSFAKGNYNDNSWSANISTLYKLFNEIDFTLNLAHAFRSPVLEERFQYINLGGDIFLGNPDLKSEEGNFIDAGFRIWEENFSVKMNFFLNTFNNLVVDKAIIPDSLFMKSNVGKASLYGFDIGLEYNLLNSLTVFSSASYVRGKDKSTSNDLPQIPPLNGKIGMKYSSLKYAAIEVTTTLYAKQDRVATGELKTAGYVLWDLYLSSMPLEVGFAKFKIFSGIENLFDKSYRNHLSTNRGLIVQEPGRNFFLRLNVEW